MNALNVLSLMQSKIHNIPLLVWNKCQYNTLNGENLSSFDLAFFTILFQHATFFAFGESNSLSSIDLSNSYNGVRSYAIPIVAFLTFFSNFLGPIWWHFATLIYMLSLKKCMHYFCDYFVLTSLFHGLAITALSIWCVILREHLFIWTVFSPKLLFQCVWFVIVHFVLSISSILFMSKRSGRTKN